MTKSTNDTHPKIYRLLGADGQPYTSLVPGLLGGNRRDKIYGKLNCSAAIRALPGFAAIRVFFADEQAAIAAGYRPCGICMRQKFNRWHTGGEPGSAEYPWLVPPT